MIVAVCADKSSPGVTTAALALAMAWPGPRLLLEADPCGGDLAFWARRSTGDGFLAAEPGLLALAADARTGVSEDALPQYAQLTRWGVDVIAGPPSAHAYTPMRTLWPAVADTAAAWPGTVIADLGRLFPGTPSLAVAGTATAVLVLTRLSVEALYHLRDRVTDLAHAVGDPSLPCSPVAVMVAAVPGEAAVAVKQVAQVLEAVGSPVPVIGSIAVDHPTAGRLRRGEVPGRPQRTELLRSAGALVAAVRERWPQPAAPPGSEVETRGPLAEAPVGTTPGAAGGVGSWNGPGAGRGDARNQGATP